MRDRGDEQEGEADAGDHAAERGDRGAEGGDPVGEGGADEGDDAAGNGHGEAHEENPRPGAEEAAGVAFELSILQRGEPARPESGQAPGRQARPVTPT